MRTRSLCLVVVLLGMLLFAPHAHAQALNPNNTVDWVGQIDQWTAMLVNQHIDVFGTEGLDMLHSIAVILLVYTFCVMLMSQTFHFEKLIQFVFVYLFAYTMLQFYDSPLPGAKGLSFHQLFSAESRWVASTLDLTTVDDLSKQLATLMKNMEHPGPLNVLGLVVYFLMMLDLAGIWFLSIGVTATGYVGTGCFSLVGPLCIPFLVWDQLSFIFWGWFRGMLAYSFIRAFASCILYVYAHVLSAFITNVIGGDYTLGHLAGIVWPFTALNLCFLFALAGSCIPMAMGLFGAAGSLSSPFSGAARAVSRLFS